jgi:riboflavin kinase / FMN adenylyltransferase
MSVFHSLESASGRFGPAALAIGNFDGVHIGHQALLHSTVAYARGHDLVPAVLTFDPHPTAVVAPHRQPEMICTIEDRIRLLQAAGADKILVLPFTEQLARMMPDEFVERILLSNLQTRAVFVGQNFRFGCRQSGTPETLAELGRNLNFEAHFLAPVILRGEIVSSSLIRKDLANSRVVRAARFLNRWFSLRGHVAPGHGVGRKQTVPTLNLTPTPGVVCPRGVFVTETVEPRTNRIWPSITNVGVRPTFGGDELTIETYLLSKLEGDSPGEIEVRFQHFLRGERRFPTPEDLKAQIMRDIARAQVFRSRLSKLQKPLPWIYC